MPDDLRVNVVKNESLSSSGGKTANKHEMLYDCISMGIPGQGAVIALKKTQGGSGLRQ